MENLFLDAGGVILDEKTHETARAKLTVQILSRLIPKYSLTQYWKDVEKGVSLYAPSLYRYIFWLHTQNIPLYESTYSEYRLKWKKQNNPLILMEKLGDTLRILSNKYRLGILGQYGSDLKELLAENNLLTYFTFKNTQDDFSITKPDPRYFELVLKQAGVNPEMCIMVGDRIDKDIIPAKMIGMKTVRVKTGLHKHQIPRTPEEIPDYEVASVFDLTKIL